MAEEDAPRLNLPRGHPALPFTHKNKKSNPARFSWSAKPKGKFARTKRA